jgi:DNA-binding NarL/FixJ family response regulator
MQKIKVLLARRSKFLFVVIQNMIERQPDMEVIGEVLDPIELLVAARTTPVDVVLVTPIESSGEPKICQDLLAEYPHLRIVTISENGKSAYLYEAGSRKKRINGPSRESIFSVIRNSVALNGNGSMVLYKESGV